MLLACLGLLVLSSGCGKEESPYPDAVEAAREWVAIVDAERYGDSWDSASDIFKEGITRSAWEASMTKLRKPLGASVERTLNNVYKMPQMPGTSGGEYLAIRFESSFKMRPLAIERVAVARQVDSWEVWGYVVQPLVE
jgi:hypothetical protein